MQDQIYLVSRDKFKTIIIRHNKVFSNSYYCNVKRNYFAIDISSSRIPGRPLDGDDDYDDDEDGKNGVALHTKINL